MRVKVLVTTIFMGIVLFGGPVVQRNAKEVI